MRNLTPDCNEISKRFFSQKSIYTKLFSSVNSAQIMCLLDIMSLSFYPLASHRKTFCLQKIHQQTFCLQAIHLQTFCLQAINLQTFCLQAIHQQTFCLQAINLQTFCLQAINLQTFCLQAMNLQTIIYRHNVYSHFV
jgi:hypothetical protein